MTTQTIRERLVLIVAAVAVVVAVAAVAASDEPRAPRGPLGRYQATAATCTNPSAGPRNRFTTLKSHVCVVIIDTSTGEIVRTSLESM